MGVFFSEVPEPQGPGTSNVLTKMWFATGNGKAKAATMKCPNCGEDDSKVIDTTEIRAGIRRRRECRVCGDRFTTYERTQSITPRLIKSNGNREEFDRDKLKRGIWMACGKRPVPADDVERLTSRIETHLQTLYRAEVSSRVVGDLVIAGLKELDPIAYIRYAIVYLGLDNLESIRSEIDKLLTEQQTANPSVTPAQPAPDGDPDDPNKEQLPNF